MPSPMYLLVGNPTAQSGKNAARIEKAMAQLDASGRGVTLLATLPGGRTVEAVANALDRGGYGCVIAMGGDGTFREVAAGLLASTRRTEVAMGMLPTGTANDQGRSFGLEAAEGALAHNVEVVLAGKETHLDAGVLHAMDKAGKVVRKDAFFDSAGWGISARVLALRNKDREVVEQLDVVKDLYRDKLVYAGALLRTFLESYVTNDKFRCVVTADGVRHDLEGLTDLIVKGTRIYGGAWVFDRTSRHDDGLFEVIPFRGKRDWTSKAIVDLDGNPLGEEVLNAVGIEHSKPFRGAVIDMTFTVPDDAVALAAQIDGEEYPATPRVRVEVLHEALRLVVP